MNSLEQELENLKKGYEKALWLYVQGYMTEGEYNKVRKRINEQIIIAKRLMEQDG